MLQKYVIWNTKLIFNNFTFYLQLLLIAQCMFLHIFPMYMSIYMFIYSIYISAKNSGILYILSQNLLLSLNNNLRQLSTPCGLFNYLLYYIFNKTENLFFRHKNYILGIPCFNIIAIVLLVYLSKIVQTLMKLYIAHFPALN